MLRKGNSLTEKSKDLYKKDRIQKIIQRKQNLIKRTHAFC